MMHVWDLVGPGFAHDPGPDASNDELWLRIQAIWNFFQQADIQKLFFSMPRHITARLKHIVSTPKTDFGFLFIFLFFYFFFENFDYYLYRSFMH